METIAAAPAVEEQPPTRRAVAPEDEPTTRERRELHALELREAIARKLRPA